MTDTDGSKEDYLLVLLNEAWATLKPPVSYAVFNKQLPAGVHGKDLIKLEEISPKLGIVKDVQENGRNINYAGITTLSIIATITDVLCGKRLAAVLDDKDNITGWTWYKQQKL